MEGRTKAADGSMRASMHVTAVVLVSVDSGIWGGEERTDGEFVGGRGGEVAVRE